MALLTAAERQAAFVEHCREMSLRPEPFNLSKTDLIAAIAATDDWIDANAAAYNAALPATARTTLTASQKKELFLRVAKKRWGG